MSPHVRSPAIILEAPPGERERLIYIEIGLGNLGMRCEEFGAAVAWMDHAEQVQPTVMGSPEARHALQWCFMAADAAASAVYKFSEDMEILSINLNKCSVVRGAFDVGAKRAATRLFSKHFPDFAGVRHSGQHAAKLYGTPEAVAEHSPGPIAGFHNLEGRELVTSFKGKRVSLDVTERSAEKLREVRDLYWSAFWHLDPMWRAFNRS